MITTNKRDADRQNRIHAVTVQVRHRSGPDAKVHATLEQDHVSPTYISTSKQMSKTRQMQLIQQTYTTV